MKRRYKHLFFDLDDTLFDFTACSTMALEALYQENMLSPYFGTFTHFFETYSEINHGLWEEYKLGKVSKDTVKYNRFILTLREGGNRNEPMARQMAETFLDKCIAMNILVDEAIPVLKVLKPHYKMHIISNGFIEVQHKKLNISKLSPYFTHVILSEDVKVQKPSPEIFEHALFISKAKKSESLMIGDNWDSDILGAKNSGIDQIYFAYNGQIPNPCEATFAITKLSQLKDILL